MKLLMITRKVDRNEHLAGFIYNWVKKLGEQVEELRVISWQEGDSSGLPENIKVEHLKTDQSKLLKVFAFKKLVKKNIKEVDGVFCHQMPIYTILAAPIAKRHKKKVVSWYMHKQVDYKMKKMEKLADVVLSASKESFRLDTKKLKITGHGIDTEKFSPGFYGQDTDEFNLMSIGRISPTKDYETMIKAVDILDDKNVILTIIGQPGLENHKAYEENLKTMVTKMNLSEQVHFLGAIKNSQIPDYLRIADAFINLSGTGSIDKAVLEAMASGTLVLTSNEAFKNILPLELMVEQNNPKALAESIRSLFDLKDKAIQLRKQLRQEVVDNHNLDNLVKKIVEQFV
ncbi:MAG: hypothetical protein CMI53_03430 [Parcubacteria group bacterium]|jgi:glycosyltransferase involved in cell wall biosynthesis|nr:hypothetical protein [Parcubacteria group bacterium]|tara:strand:+ start:1247 stop:2275 length:1029 start_codon:yes stop_codon:yes gene_type:complete